MRWALVFVVVGGCAERAPTRCEDVQVPQETRVSRVATCRQVEMGAALSLCAHERAIYPKEAKRFGALASSWDISTEDCLREWIKVFDACEDEPDMEFRCTAVR